MMPYPPMQPYDEPGIASVEDGHVLLDGPNGIAITLTPEAAIATGESLVRAGREASEHKSGGSTPRD
ncbi:MULTISPECIES: hypothetical protein [Novosphingobium]|uniref:hypothetical protein n=1 Tax=Novosphingobium sp. TCA1 TaxID=2682474 RepID=UPI00130D196D|nr:hypothetical protein [Novosphingobium sp. TCA1]GFE76598.1 hypothetical protein NTCA1_42470 [Novosphingobium sp. TCA1]